MEVRTEETVRADELEVGWWVFVGDRDWSGYRLSREWVIVTHVMTARVDEGEPPLLHVFIDYFDPGRPRPQRWAFFAAVDELLEVVRRT